MTAGRRSVARRLQSHLLLLAIVVLAGIFAAAALVRFSPGFDSLPEDLDPQIAPETLRALHAQHARENSLPVFYVRYLGRALEGDLGVSESLQRPVAELIGRRLPVTARLVAEGSLLGWVLALLTAALAARTRNAVVEAGAVSVNGLLLAIPPAVLALAFFFAEAPLALALALAIMPRLFGTLRTIFEDRFASAALLGARARGVRTSTIVTSYVLGAAAPELAALAGVTLVMAFGLAIPIEVLCDEPGLGALALQAAIARDMPLLCGVALPVTFFIAAVQTLGDLAGSRTGTNQGELA
jgi:peptide/nickel transport system permease protein